MSGSTCFRSFPREARRCTQDGETFRAQRITHYFARGQDPKRHGNAAQRRLTNRWSARVEDKVPSSYTGVRAAQLSR